MTFERTPRPPSLSPSHRRPFSASLRRVSYGFTYISALVLVAVVGFSLSMAGQYWSTIIKRERETDLLFKGDQFRRGIASYYNATPGGIEPHYPRTLDALLKDPRYPAVRRHLRRIYPDPITGGEWTLVRDAHGGIKGVASPSTRKPVKTGRFPDGYEGFEKAETYADWKFVFIPPKGTKTASNP